VSDHPPSDVKVAAFNIHCGIDGFGRPFDLAAALGRIDADVVALPEFFLADDPGATPWLDLAGSGYELVTVPLARARIGTSEPTAAEAGRWGPPRRDRARRALRLEVTGERGRARNWGGDARPGDVTGQVALGLASRIPLISKEVLPLPRLRAEALDRALLLVEVEHVAGTIVVGATHLGHLSHGSPRQIAALREALADRHRVVVAGDFNCWGPPLVRMLPCWRRVVHGATWPAWRPHSQVDHLLVRDDLAGSGEVLPPLGSDHLPVVAEIHSATPTAAVGR
jgi:endonuclease/exonuclease/phosphatase family metal-dependent hydrolase